MHWFNMGVEKAGHNAQKIFLPTLSETSDGIHTLSRNILILFCLTIFSPLIKKKSAPP